MRLRHSSGRRREQDPLHLWRTKPSGSIDCGAGTADFWVRNAKEFAKPLEKAIGIRVYAFEVRNFDRLMREMLQESFELNVVESRRDERLPVILNDLLWHTIGIACPSHHPVVSQASGRIDRLAVADERLDWAVAESLLQSHQGFFVQDVVDALSDDRSA